MSNLTLVQLQAIAASVGFPDVALAASIAMAESGGNPNAANVVTNPLPGNGPERSFGLWQINTLAHPQFNETSLLDPVYNAQAAYAVSNGGSNWAPWSTYTHGIYKQWYSGPIAPPDTTPTPGLSTGAALGLGLGLVLVTSAAAYYLSTGRSPLGLVAGEEASSSSRVQSLLLPRSRFTPAGARRWAVDHGFHARKVDVTDRYIRLRQAPPGQFQRLRTVSFGPGGIKAVVGFLP